MPEGKDTHGRGLDAGQRARLWESGYAVLPGAVPSVRRDAALRAINASLGRGLRPEDVPRFRARSFCPELQETSAILDIVGRRRARLGRHLVNGARPLVDPHPRAIAAEAAVLQGHLHGAHIQQRTHEGGIPRGGQDGGRTNAGGRDRFDHQGAVIVDLVPGGPAEDAGIVVGDTIVRFDGKDVTDPDQLGQLIRERAPGDEVTVGIVHADGSSDEVTVSLGTNPAATT